MDHKEITSKIIRAAYDVHNRLGPGFVESVYEKSLLIELKHAGLEAERQCPLTVHYRDHVVGSFLADVVVADTIILELKAVESLVVAHEVQLVNYLVAAKKPVGLLINFGPERVDIKRKVRGLQKPSC